MKKLTKKLGMSTLALASVFTLGFTTINQVSTSNIETQAAGQPLYVSRPVSTTEKSANAQNVFISSSLDIGLSYQITPTSLDFNIAFALNSNSGASGANRDVHFNSSTAGDQVSYAVTLEQTAPGATGTYSTETLMTEGTSANEATYVTNYGVTTATINSSANTELNTNLSSLTAGTQYTMKIYFAVDRTGGSNAAPINSDNAEATELAGAGRSLVFEMTFITPTSGSITAGKTLSGSTWTGTEATLTANANSGAYVDDDNSNGNIDKIDHFEPSEANARVTYTDSSTSSRYSFTVTTDGDPSNADSTDVDLEVTFSIPETFIINADKSIDTEFYWGLSVGTESTGTYVAQDLNVGGDVSLKANATYNSDVNAYEYTLDTTANATIDADFSTFEAGEGYSIRLHIADDEALTEAELIDANSSSVLMTFDFWARNSAYGSNTYTGYSIGTTSGIGTIWDQIMEDPVAASVAVGLIVTASLLLVAVIGMGAYIVVNNNKAKKAKAHTSTTHSHDKK